MSICTIAISIFPSKARELIDVLKTFRNIAIVLQKVSSFFASFKLLIQLYLDIYLL
jgi:hypothetical protein